MADQRIPRTAPPEQVVLRRPQVIAMLGVGSSAFEAIRKSPGFPPCGYISPRCPVWQRAEIEVWIASRFKEARTPIADPKAANGRAA
jgi:predicted DNA-binding transcriptional regulator AlpA